MVVINGNKTYLLTTTLNQNYDEYNDISTLKLGDCEKMLRNVYNISKFQSLLILTIDKNEEGFLSPIVEYDIFDPISKIKLNLT